MSNDQAVFTGQIDKSTSTVVTTPVTFHVFRKDGSKNPDIKHSFIEKQHLTAHDAAEGYLTLSDRTMWKLVCEPEVEEAFKGKDAVYCIISFQARVNGNFAVARLFKEGYKAKGRHS